MRVPVTLQFLLVARERGECGEGISIAAAAAAAAGHRGGSVGIASTGGEREVVLVLLIGVPCARFGGHVARGDAGCDR